MKLPAWKLERYLLGELPADELTKIQVLEISDSDLRNELARMSAENAEILAEHPYKVIPFPKKSWAAAMSACAALVISLGAISVWLFGEGIGTGEVAYETSYETRIKGAKAVLEIWRKTADSAERLSDGNLAKEGDLLQLRYNVPEKCYGALFSLDGNGTLTIHLSGTRGKAAPLTPGKLISLEKSYQLDNAPKFEKFYLITDSEEFSLAPIAEDLLHGKSPANFQVAEMELRK